MRANEECYNEALAKAEQLANYGVEHAPEADVDPHHVLCDAVAALKREMAQGSKPWEAYDDGEDGPKESRYYKEVVQVTILSEDQQVPDDLMNIAIEIANGDMVGRVEVMERAQLTPKQMADALTEAGSAPDFFELDAEGNKL